MCQNHLLSQHETLSAPRAQCACVCLCVYVCVPLSQTDYTSVPLYLPSISLHPVIYSNSPSSSESGSKSELHLFASRNSIPAPALQSRGNIPALILPDSPKGDTLGLRILYEVKQLQEPPHPPCSGALCLCRRLVTVSVYTLLHSQGSGSEQEVFEWTSLGLLRFTSTDLSDGFKGAKRIFLCRLRLHL